MDASRRSPAELFYNMALTMVEEGNLRGAVPMLKKTLEIDPSHARAWYHLGTATASLGQKDLALQLLEKAAELEPGNPLFWAKLGNVRQTLNLIEGEKGALSAWEHALRLDPGLDVVWYNAGVTFLNCEMPDRALYYFQKATGLGHPQAKEALVTLREAGHAPTNPW